VSPRTLPDAVICAAVGCENLVPFADWPQDRKLPKFCIDCLRANQTRPSVAKREPLPHECDNDFDLLVAS